jgi:excisionase family DNA binding protein
MERNDEILTINELMEILKVTRKTLLLYISKGKIKAFKVGNQWRITRDSLNNYIDRFTK